MLGALKPAAASAALAVHGSMCPRGAPAPLILLLEQARCMEAARNVCQRLEGTYAAVAHAHTLARLGTVMLARSQ